MIRLTRLTRGPFLLNPDLIEHVEMTPDTVVTLRNGHQYVVRESVSEVATRILDFQRAVFRDGPYSVGPFDCGGNGAEQP
jgi:flagellar protein FlbD